MNTYVVFLPESTQPFSAEFVSKQTLLDRFESDATDFLYAARQAGRGVDRLELLEVSGPEQESEPRFLSALRAVIVEADDAMASGMIASGAIVVPNVMFSNVSPVTPPVASLAPPVPWHLSKTNVALARTQNLTGEGTLVGVLDTGIDASHSEFAGKTIHFMEFDALGKQVSTSARDAGHHGTHVCGIIAGKTVGVAPDASLAVACVLNQTNGSGTFAAIAAGLNWLATSTFEGLEVDVVNASLGTGMYDPTLYQPISNARTIDDVLVIAAIGNNGRSGMNHHGSPGNYDIDLGVGSTDVNDTVSALSDWGTVTQHGGIPKPDLVAPGENILSSLPGGAYGVLSGTSMAAPMVAGAVALAIQKNPGLRRNPAQLIAKLLTLVTPIASTGRAGNGRLDFTSI